MAVEWKKHGTKLAAAAALLGVQSVSRAEYSRFVRFLDGNALAWPERDWHGPDDIVPLTDQRINDYTFCSKTNASSSLTAQFINDGRSDDSCANAGLEFVPSSKILKLAAAVGKLNPELDDAEATSAVVNSFDVIEAKFSPKGHLYSREDAFHVRRKPCL